MASSEFRGMSKKGILTYRLKVFVGRLDSQDGKQVTASQTWHAPKYMSRAEADVEADIQATIYEDRINGRGKEIDPDITLYDYCVYFINTSPASPRVIELYEYLLPVISDYFKKDRLVNVSSNKIGKFYAYLPTRTKKDGGSCFAKENLKIVFEGCKISMNRFYSDYGVCHSTLTTALKGKSITWRVAEKISAVLDQKTEDLFDFVEGSDKYSDEAIYKFHRFLHAVFEQAIRDEMVKKNITENVRPPKYPRNKAKFLDDRLARAFFFAALREKVMKLKVVIFALLFTGMRRGELMALQWKDIAPIDCTIDINKATAYTKKLGVFVKDTKNEGSDRMVVIPPFAVDVFKQYAQDYHNCMVNFQQERDATGGNWVFCQKSGELKSPKTIATWIDQFTETHDLPKYNPHAFRHTYITLQNVLGTDLSTLGSSTGHSNPKVLLGTYTHGVMSAKKRASDNYSKVFLGSGGEESADDFDE